MKTDDTHTPVLMTTEQIAELVQVHPTTLRDWSREGRIRHFRFGRVLRFRLDDVLEDLACPSR